MPPALDLEPAARQVASLLDGVTEDQLVAAAAKDRGKATSQGPSADAARLIGDWRARIRDELVIHGWDVARQRAPTLHRMIGLSGRAPWWSAG